ILQQVAISYEFLRRYAEAGLAWDRVVAIQPNDVETKAERALVELNWKADTRPLHQLIDSIRVADSGALSSAGDAWLICALAERDTSAAQDALIAMGETPLRDGTVQFSRAFVEGIIAQMTKDESKARVAFSVARSEQEKIVQAQPDYGP